MSWLSELRFTADKGFEAPNSFLQGRAVAVLGGGPSLTATIASALEAAGPVIAVNNAFMLLRNPGLVVALDRRWFVWHGAALEAAGHIVVTGLRPGEAPPLPKNLHVMNKAREEIMPPDRYTLSGTNSGHGACALAYLLGARTIYTAGFDMTFRNGRSHWHKGHRIPSSQANYEARFRPKYEDLARELAERGVRLASVTPTSANVETVALSAALRDLHDTNRVDHPQT